PTYVTPALQGNYSVLLLGGEAVGNNTNGASIGQSGQIPNAARSITYWGGSRNSLQITFAGHLLAFSVISNVNSYTVFGADISAYAGQTGELLFHAPPQTGGGMIDVIQFSSQPIPEPGFLGLWGLAALLASGRVLQRKSATSSANHTMQRMRAS